MEQISSEIYKKLAKRLWLIFDSDLIKTDKQLITILNKQINILNLLEKRYKQDVDLGSKFLSKTLCETGNNKVNNAFSLDEQFTLSDDDIIDSINYLSVYFKNVYKVNDLDQLYLQYTLNNSQTQSNPLLKNKLDNLNNSSIKIENQDHYIKQAKDLLVSGSIYSMISKGAREGKIYLYDSKPKIIPILKWISCIMIWLLAGCLFCLAIFGLISSGLRYNDGSQSNDKIINLYFEGFLYFIIATYSSFFSFNIIKPLIIKGKKYNDNHIFYYPWESYLFLLVCVIAILLSNLPVLWFNTNLLVSYNTSVQITSFYAFKYVFIVGLTISCLNILTLIFISVFNPKKDSKRLKELAQSYKDQVNNQQPDNQSDGK